MGEFEPGDKVIIARGITCGEFTNKRTGTVVGFKVPKNKGNTLVRVDIHGENHTWLYEKEQLDKITELEREVMETNGT